MPTPPTYDVEPERADQSRRRVPLIALGALALLVVVIGAIVIAGNSGDDDDDEARVSSITDLINTERSGDRVEVSGQVLAIQQAGRIFAISEPGVAAPSTEGAILVVSERPVNVQEGDAVTVTGRVYELDSQEVAEAAGKRLGESGGYPEYLTQPAIVASSVTAG